MRIWFISTLAEQVAKKKNNIDLFDGFGVFHTPITQNKRKIAELATVRISALKLHGFHVHKC
jgi:hypothetical protein